MSKYDIVQEFDYKLICSLYRDILIAFNISSATKDYLTTTKEEWDTKERRFKKHTYFKMIVTFPDGTEEYSYCCASCCVLQKFAKHKDE